MRRMLFKRLACVLAAAAVIIMGCYMIFQVASYEKDMELETHNLFTQITQVLVQNSKELEKVKETYSQLCLNYADAVAYILHETPETMYDIDELKKIAAFMQVDEIHVFNEEGRIVCGTEPKYYDMTVEDGEQIGFFAPMFEDRSLRLSQEMMPNTSEEKEMQYAAVWNETKDFVVQVGITPHRLKDVIRQNQLSHIFSLLMFGEGTELYALHPETLAVLGTTGAESLPQDLLDQLKERLQKAGNNSTGGFYAELFGETCFCMAENIGGAVLLRTCTRAEVFKDLDVTTLQTTLCLVLITAFIVWTISSYLNNKIVRSIDEINRKLMEITDGRLEETVSVCTTPEFAELSSYINSMVGSILAFTDKMSSVLDRAQVPMGVYEYNQGVSKVRFTKQVPKILYLDKNEETMLGDSTLFEKHLQLLKTQPVSDFENTYRILGEEERYIRMEQFEKDHNIMGILIDVTEEVTRNRNLIKERDIDILTGFYNRRALDNMLDKLFEEPEKLGHGVLVMLDSDGLKQINDCYGHDSGDQYLRATAEALKTMQTPDSVFSRQGGDEFVLFFYGCESEEEAASHVNRLIEIQNNTTLVLPDGKEYPVTFSFGCSFSYGRGNNYSLLLREADQKMYAEKSRRKAQRLKEDMDGSQTI